MKLIGLIIRAAAVLSFSGCVSHSVINAKTATVTLSPTTTLRVSGLPLSMP